MNPLEIEYLNGMKIIITNMITKDVQARRHRKKRINKKWLKRYGLKAVPDDEKVIVTDGTLFMTKRCFNRLEKHLHRGMSKDDIEWFKNMHEELKERYDGKC